MPEILRAAIGSIVRWLLTGLAGYLVAHGALTEGQAGELLLTVGSGVAALVWSLWRKYRARLKFITALELPANASVDQVKDVIANTPASTNVGKVLSQ